MFGRIFTTIMAFIISVSQWIFYNSIVETAKANKLNPYEYLNHLLTVIPQHMNDTNTDFAKDLLPWSIALPSACHNRI